VLRTPCDQLRTAQACLVMRAVRILHADYFLRLVLIGLPRCVCLTLPLLPSISGVCTAPTPLLTLAAPVTHPQMNIHVASTQRFAYLGRVLFNRHQCTQVCRPCAKPSHAQLHPTSPKTPEAPLCRYTQAALQANGRLTSADAHAHARCSLPFLARWLPLPSTSYAAIFLHSQGISLQSGP
jgi:hypothetical protein